MKLEAYWGRKEMKIRIEKSIGKKAKNKNELTISLMQPSSWIVFMLEWGREANKYNIYNL